MTYQSENIKFGSVNEQTLKRLTLNPLVTTTLDDILFYFYLFIIFFFQIRLNISSRWFILNAKLFYSVKITKPILKYRLITKTCLYNFDPLKPHF